MEPVRVHSQFSNDSTIVRAPDYVDAMVLGVATEELYVVPSATKVVKMAGTADYFVRPIRATSNNVSVTTATTADKLTDAAADFVAMGLVAGDLLYSLDNKDYTTVTAVDSATVLSVAADIFQDAENYIAYGGTAGGIAATIAAEVADGTAPVLNPSDWALWDKQRPVVALSFISPAASIISIASYS